MVDIIDLEDEDESPNVSPSTAKKRTHDGNVKDAPRLHGSGPGPSLSVSHAGEDSPVLMTQAIDLEIDSGPEEEALDFADIKEHLCDVLAQINEYSNGTFATSGNLPNAVNPGLSVKGLGGIGLPLSEHDAHRIIDLCKARLLDSAEDSISYNSTKHHWTLPVSEFTLRNPAWPQTASKALDKIAIDLGITTGSGSIQAEICSLELYDRGACSEDACLRPLAKRTTASGILGTLLIALPSSHTGGSVEVRFGTEKRQLETAPSSDFDVSFLSWYQDVGIDFHELASGYRLFLVYHLIQDGARAPYSAAGLGTDQQKVIDALRGWRVAQGTRNSVSIRGPVAYKLEHTYDDLEFNLNHLRGRDRVRVQLLQHACQELGFSLFLADIELTVTGSIDKRRYDDYDDCWPINENAHHSIVYEHSRELQLKVVRFLDGSVYTEKVDFEQDNFLQDYATVFGNLPAEENNEDYYDGSVTHYYRKQCFLVLPKKFQEYLVFESVIQSKDKTKSLLCDLLKTVEEVKSKRTGLIASASPEPCQTSLERFCKMIVTESSPFIFESNLTDLVTAAVLLDRHSLFRSIASKYHSALPYDAYFKIGLALPFDVANPTEWLNEIADRARNSKILRHRLGARYTVLQGAETSLQTAGRIGQIDVDSIRAWMWSEIDAKLDNALPLTSKDAKVLASLASKHPGRDQFLLNTLSPFVIKNIAKRAFVLAFLFCVYVSYENKSCGGEYFRKETVARLHKDVLGALMQVLFEAPPSSKKVKYQASAYPALQRSAASVTDPPLPGDIARLVCTCHYLGLESYAEAILANVAERCGCYPVETFHGIWMPFLEEFMTLFEQDHSLRQYGHIFRTVIDAYVRRYLGVRPPTPVITPIVHRGCGCAQCDAVDSFLHDPQRQVGYFRYRETVRKHLEKQLASKFKLRTITGGSPLTLVVTKNEAEYNAKCDLTAYKERRKLAQQAIGRIGIAKLNALLGTKGQELTDFSSVRNRLVVAGRIPMAPLQQSANSQPSNQPSNAEKTTGTYSKASSAVKPRGTRVG